MRFLITILMLFTLPFQSAYVLAAQSCTHAPDSVSQAYDSSDSDNSHFGHHSCESDGDTFALDNPVTPTDKQVADHSDHLNHVSYADVVNASYQLAYVLSETSEPRLNNISTIYTNPFLGMLLPPPNHVPA